jgi:Alcohol dehydrogenase GroES-like domain
MPNAVVMTGYGPPKVLKWAGVPLAEPGEGQIRLKVKAADVSPTDLALRAGYLKAIPLPADAVLGFEAAGTVDAVGPGVTGTSIGDGVTALLFGLGGYAQYAVASIWTGKPGTVSWIDAAARGVSACRPPSAVNRSGGGCPHITSCSATTCLARPPDRWAGPDASSAMPRPERHTDRPAHRHALTSGCRRRDARPQRPFPNTALLPAPNFAVPLMKAALRLSRILGSGRIRDPLSETASAPTDRKLRARAENRCLRLTRLAHHARRP